MGRGKRQDRELDNKNIINLPVEHVSDIPGELLSSPLMQESEVCRGVTRPGAGLGLSIALEEETNTFSVAVLKIKFSN